MIYIRSYTFAPYFIGITKEIKRFQHLFSFVHSYKLTNVSFLLPLNPQLHTLKEQYVIVVHGRIGRFLLINICVKTHFQKNYKTIFKTKRTHKNKENEVFLKTKVVAFTNQITIDKKENRLIGPFMQFFIGFLYK